MTETPLIRINFDSPEKIAKLYGIGSKIAHRIVEQRKLIGAFHGPDELAQVKGISIDLAITLAPNIDWELPRVQNVSKERDWFWAIVYFVIIVALFRTVIVETLPVVSQTLKFHYGWLSLWINFSILIGNIFAILFLMANILFCLIRDSVKAKKALRIGWAFCIIWVLCRLSLGLGNAAYYQFFAPNKWADLMENQKALIAAVGISGAVLTFLPNIFVFLLPKLRYSSILARIYDIGIIISGPIFATMVWVFRSSLPLWILILIGLLGCYYAYIGFIVIRWRESFFESAVAVFDSPQEKENKSSAWLSWINARLPNPEQQQALKDALDKTYPPSKFKTIVGFVVISSGGWLILTALGAVIQWFIEKGLNQLWP